MKVEARLTFDKIRCDQDTDAHLVISLTAPSIEEQVKRPALCIIPLIDVSASMQGQKIEYAKRSVAKLIEHLGAEDYCGLVKFSETAEVIQRPVKITTESKETLKRKVTELQIGSATNIADALLLGLDIGNKADLPGSVIVRVILFTDGQANRGSATNLQDLVKLIDGNLGSCTASAFGYGKDADQNLLGELAKKGSGNYAFVQNPDDALTAFGKELGGLLSTYATNLSIHVSAAWEHEIVDVISDVDSEEDKVSEGVYIKIPDILAEETRHIVFGVKLKAPKAGGPRAVNLFNVKAGWDILDVNSKKERKSAEVKANAQFVKSGEEQATTDKDLAQIVSLAQVVRAQIEAEEKAKKGDFQGAVRHMTNAAVQLGIHGQQQAAYIAHQVSARLGSAAQYATNAGYLRSVATGGTRGYGGASYDAQAAVDLGNAGVVLCNSTQTSTSSSFTGDNIPLSVGGSVGSALPVGGLTYTTTGSLPDNIGTPPPLDLSGSLHPMAVTTVGSVNVMGNYTPDNLDAILGHGHHATLGVVPMPVIDLPPPPQTDSEKEEDKPKSKKRLVKKSQRW